MADTELKPCPFCGGEPALSAGADTGLNDLAFCTVCGANIDGRLFSLTEPRAHTLWNRRAPDPLTERLAEALGAIGVIGGGYCFCSSNRDPNSSVHQPECRDARAALRAYEESRK